MNLRDTYSSFKTAAFKIKVYAYCCMLTDYSVKVHRSGFRPGHPQRSFAMNVRFTINIFLMYKKYTKSYCTQSQPYSSSWNSVK